jgi:hypothetical protein
MPSILYTAPTLIEVDIPEKFAIVAELNVLAVETIPTAGALSTPVWAASATENTDRLLLTLLTADHMLLISTLTIELRRSENAAAVTLPTLVASEIVLDSALRAD